MRIAFCFTLLLATFAAAGANTASDVLARSITTYRDLQSYADTGTVIRETPGVVDRGKFKTFYRRQSLDFYFDFQWLSSENPKMPQAKLDLSAKRSVFWMIKGNLQTYQQESRSHNSYPREGGNQTAPLQNATAGTGGASLLIPSLLFAKSNLPGTVREIEQSSDAGFEDVDGHRCYKVTAIASQYYPSGARTNIRPVTVWIDAGTLLIRKLFEDTPKGYALGTYSRVTLTFDPQSNPPLDDSKFQFTVPGGGH